MNEATEKAWNAIDVSRKAEKEISNKEWNERTSKKLDMLKKLNDAGKFKKDWDEETLQGWVDQNFSWEKVSKKFKLNESSDIRKVIRKIIREQNFDQRLAKAMGMSDDEFQDKVASRDVSGESMSNADIGALQKLVGNYSLEKILKTIAIIADRGGMNDEAFEIENFLKTFNKN
jgi:hypothetical protein